MFPQELHELEDNETLERTEIQVREVEQDDEVRDQRLRHLELTYEVLEEMG